MGLGRPGEKKWNGLKHDDEEMEKLRRQADFCHALPPCNIRTFNYTSRLFRRRRGSGRSIALADCVGSPTLVAQSFNWS